MQLGRVIDNCRMCSAVDFFEFLDLGFMPPADGILSKKDLENPQTLFPLKVLQCLNCGLVQLKYVVNPKLLYNQNYSYETSITETGRHHFFDMADSIIQKFDQLDNPLVLDVGSNVGVLLERFRKKGWSVLGVDPVSKLVDIATKKGVETWCSFFNKDIAKKVVSEKGKVKVFCATNVFAHIDNKKEFMESLDILLEEEGILVIEAPYFVDLVDNLEYDTIYLDHLEYLSVKPLVQFFDSYGFDLFDVEKHEIHGGSIRVFVSRKGKRKISESVSNFLKLEEEKGIYKKETLVSFSQNVENHRKEFVQFLLKLKAQGKKIVGISAPAKGNTLLNYCKISHHSIDFLVEKSELKQGYYSPGMHIPIVDEKKLLEEKPDYGIIFAWNFAKEIMNNNKSFADRGGKFIIPIPSPSIVEKI